MAPLKPFWTQPSHADVQEVIIFNEDEFSSKSLSRVEVPPFGLFAKLNFPPCTTAEKPTYATVQMGRDAHLNLNSDLLYINHSCDPSLIFDMTRREILAGPKGLQPGDELTFFYPSTEWNMAQGFDCLCGAATCRGYIAGARNMTTAQLAGVWLNAHIRDLLDAQRAAAPNGYKTPRGANHAPVDADAAWGSDSGVSLSLGAADESQRHGPGSRSLSGEMSGDTVAPAQ